MPVPVHVPAPEAEVEPLAHGHFGQMPPVAGTGAGDVDEAHGVGAPVRDGKIPAVRGGREHLGQGARLHEAHDLVGGGVHDAHGGGILGVAVPVAAVVGDPEVAALVGEDHLDGLAGKAVHAGVHAELERVEPGGLGPEPGLGGAEGMAYDLELGVVGCAVDHGGAAFQRVHVVLRAVRVHDHGLGRVDVGVPALGRSRIVLLEPGGQEESSARQRKTRPCGPCLGGIGSCQPPALSLPGC